jgi:AcrR family transcriptional regulator
MNMAHKQPPDPVRTRLLKAALECFLADEYHKVTTRLIAEKVDANISMIRYYFGSKEGLYEEMIRETLMFVGGLPRQIHPTILRFWKSK